MRRPIRHGKGSGKGLVRRRGGEGEGALGVIGWMGLHIGECREVGLREVGLCRTERLETY